MSVRRIPAWFRARPFVTDGLLAVALAVAGLAELVAIDDPRVDPGVLVAAVAVLVVLQAVPVAVRRRWPTWSLMLTGAATVVLNVMRVPEVVSAIGVLICLYSVARYADRQTSLLAAKITAVIITVSVAVVLVQAPTVLLPLEFAVYVGANYVMFGTAWLIGDRIRTARERRVEQAERIARLEQEREEKARRAVAEERTRIARELHDVIAHHVNVMIVQAAGARRSIAKNPDAAVQALVEVEDTGRAAMTEMRRLLGILREDYPEGELAPQPSLADLDTLVDGVRASGLSVAVEVEGAPRELQPGADLCAYRIVQEALTNVIRHADAQHATVRITYARETVELDVCDDGLGAAGSGNGQGSASHGVVGMRERVALFGGTLDAGPVPGGGFRVRALIPTTAVDQP